MTKAFLAAFILLASVHASAEASNAFFDEDSCMTRESFDFAIKGYELTGVVDQIDLCNHEDVRVKTVKALFMLKMAEFTDSVASPGKLFTNELSNVNRPNEFFTSRVSKINFENCQQTIKSSDAGAYVWPKNKQNIYVCIDNGAGLPSSEYLNFLVHESRHLDNDDIGHATCTQGNQKGSEGACDHSFEQRGAYYFGLQYQLLIAKHGKNFHPVTRYRSMLFASGTADNKFNSPAPKEMHNVLILREVGTKKLWMLNSSDSVEPLAITVPGKIVEMNQGYYVSYSDSDKELRRYDLLNGDAKKTIAESNPDPGMEAWFVFQPKDTRPPLKSVGRGLMGVLYGDKLDYGFVVGDRDYKAGTMTLPSQDFVEIVSGYTCGDQEDYNKIFLRTVKNEFFEVSPDANQQPQVKPTKACNLSIIDGVKFGSQEFVLGRDGNIYENKAGALELVSAVKGKKFDFISHETPVIDFMPLK